jgi:hypothetical protein
MKEEIGIQDISTFLLNTFKVTDPLAELPDIINMPLRLYRNENQQLIVLRKLESFNIEEVVDEFANGEIINQQ